MKVSFTKDEKEMVYAVYHAIAVDPERKMTEEEARVMTAVLKRTNNDAPSDPEFHALHLLSIKNIFEGTLNSLPKDQHEEYPLFGTVLKKVSRLVK